MLFSLLHPLPRAFGKLSVAIFTTTVSVSASAVIVSKPLVSEPSDDSLSASQKAIQDSDEHGNVKYHNPAQGNVASAEPMPNKPLNEDFVSKKGNMTIPPQAVQTSATVSSMNTVRVNEHVTNQESSNTKLSTKTLNTSNIDITEKTVRLVRKPPPKQPMGFVKLKVEPSKKTYRVGEPISFNVSATNDYYLYVFSRDAKTKGLIMLLPHADTKNYHYRKGERYNIPESVYFMSDRRGKEDFLFIGSTQPLPLEKIQQTPLGRHSSFKAGSVQNIMYRMNPQKTNHASKPKLEVTHVSLNIR